MSVEVIQLFEKVTSTYTYIVFDKESLEALVIDSVDVCHERDRDLITKLDLDIKYSLETHIHADHITGAWKLKEKFGCLLGVSKFSKSNCADLLLEDQQILKLGKADILCIATPGHTSTCTSFYVDNNIFTGDALLINGCGRTDFQEGSNKNLFSSVRDKIFTLPKSTKVYPGHDYKGYTASTVAFEKKFNKRLKLENSYEAFEEIMNSLNLSQPSKIKEAVPANINLGRQ